MDKKIYSFCLFSLAFVSLFVGFRAISWQQSYDSSIIPIVEAASTTPVEVALISTEASSTAETTNNQFSKQLSLNSASANKMNLDPLYQSSQRSSLTYESTLPTIDEIKDILAIIAQCESGGNELARNPHSSAKGLLQIIDGTWEHFNCDGSVLNGEDNMRCGIKIALANASFRDWDASRACWSRKMPQELAIHTY